MYDGTVAGAIRKFRTLPSKQQSEIEMMVDAGVIADQSATIVSYDALRQIAARADVPQ